MQSTITELSGFRHLTDLPCWQLSHAGSTVVISSYGAHVLHYQTPSQPSSDIDHQPQALQLDDSATPSAHLWLSDTAFWRQQQPIRGGIPICWPWFGKIDAQLLSNVAPSARATRKLPNHGLVRTRLWQVTKQQITVDAVEIEFSLVVDDIPWSDEVVTLRYQVRLADQLSLTLICDAHIVQQGALHSYFAVTDSRQTKVHPLPRHFYDKVSDSQQQCLTDSLYFDGEIDRVYANPAATILLEDEQTTRHILQQGHDAAILWNPAAEKAVHSVDIPADQWSQFVCVESARLNLDSAPLRLVQIIHPM